MLEQNRRTQASHTRETGCSYSRAAGRGRWLCPSPLGGAPPARCLADSRGPGVAPISCGASSAARALLSAMKCLPPSGRSRAWAPHKALLVGLPHRQPTRLSVTHSLAISFVWLRSVCLPGAGSGTAVQCRQLGRGQLPFGSRLLAPFLWAVDTLHASTHAMEPSPSGLPKTASGAGMCSLPTRRSANPEQQKKNPVTQ